MEEVDSMDNTGKVDGKSDGRLHSLRDITTLQLDCNEEES